MKYDDASWHYGGEYPEGLPDENGATHIGMFLAWVIENDLVSDELREDAARELALVKKRKMTGASFLMRVCDEKLADVDLSPAGNLFAKRYFAKDLYMDDYSDLFDAEVDSLYELEDSWKNYDRLRPVLTRRYQELVLSAKKKPAGKATKPAAKKAAKPAAKKTAKKAAKPAAKKTAKKGTKITRTTRRK